MISKQKGFGLIGLLITIVTIAVLVWGGFTVNKNQKQNRIQAGEEAIKKAEDAANRQNTRTENLLENLNINPGY